MNPLLIGIDSGTTSTKAILFDAAGSVLASFSEGYSYAESAPGHVEQRPSDWWAAAANGIRALAAAAEGKGQVAALALSTQGGTVMPVDEHYQPLANAVTWIDKRAASQAKAIAEQIGPHALDERTGLNLGAAGVLAKLAWWRDERPELHQAAAGFAQVNDYLVCRLTGQRACDPSNAVIAGLYHLDRGDWDHELLGLAGVRADQVAPICASGSPVGPVRPEVAEDLGLPPDVVVASGGHDQYCGALGCGVVDEGVGMVSCGTAWVLLVATEHLVRDPQRRFLAGVHTAEARYGLMAAMSNGGIAWDTMRRIVLGAEADGINAGARDEELRALDERGVPMVFLPHLTGAAAPWRLPDPRACLIGVQPHTTQTEVMFAVMQGLCLETRCALDAMREIGVDVRALRIMGGAAKSRLWCQLLADVCQVEVRVPSHTEAACRGAAVLAGKAAGLFPSAIDGCRRMLPEEQVVAPRPERAPRYEKLHQAHTAAMAGLDATFAYLADLRERLAALEPAP